MAGFVSSLHLDYGADAQDCDEHSVEICELGMKVRSRWRFEVGTQLSLDFVCDCARCTAEVTVVSCLADRSEPDVFESTLLFAEFPEELRACLGAG